MIWSGFRTRLEMMLTGFSSAMCGTGAPNNKRTKANASSVNFGSRKPRLVQCIPLTDK